MESTSHKKFASRHPLDVIREKIESYHRDRNTVPGSTHRKKEKLPLCDCHPADGKNELRQLKRFWNLHLGMSEHESVSVEDTAKLIIKGDLYEGMKGGYSDLKQYTHTLNNLTKSVSEHGHNLARFTISERYNSETTHGGTTFKIVIRGFYTRAACSYTDSFDGEYQVCCIIRESASIVDIYLMNVNFWSYQLYESHHVLVQSLEIDTERPSINSDGQRSTLVLSRQNAHCEFDDDYWLNDTKFGWKNVHKDKTYEAMDTYDFEKCMNIRYDNTVTVIGDGHARMVFYYIHAGIRNHFFDIDIHDNVIIARNDTYHRSTYAKVLADQLTTIYEGAKHKIEIHPQSEKIPRKLLIVDVGSWDLTFTSSAQFIVDFMKVLKRLKLLKEQNLYEIVWQTLPTRPHDVEHAIGRNINTYIIGAVTNWMVLKLIDLEIPVVNLWRLAFPFEDTVTTCGEHYLCRTGKTFYGSVGVEGAQAIIRAACLRRR